MAATIMTSVNSMKFYFEILEFDESYLTWIWWIILNFVRGEKFSKQSGGFKSIQLYGRVGKNWSEQLVLFFIIIFYQKEPFAHRGPALKKFGPKKSIQNHYISPSHAWNMVPWNRVNPSALSKVFVFMEKLCFSFDCDEIWPLSNHFGQ